MLQISVFLHISIWPFDILLKRFQILYIIIYNILNVSYQQILNHQWILMRTSCCESKYSYHVANFSLFLIKIYCITQICTSNKEISASKIPSSAAGMFRWVLLPIKLQFCVAYLAARRVHCTMVVDKAMGWGSR